MRLAIYNFIFFINYFKESIYYKNALRFWQILQNLIHFFYAFIILHIHTIAYTKDSAKHIIKPLNIKISIKSIIHLYK